MFLLHIVIVLCIKIDIKLFKESLMFLIFDEYILQYVLSLIEEYDNFILSLVCKKTYNYLKQKSSIKYRDDMFMSMSRLIWAWDLPYFYIDTIEHQYMLCELAINMNNYESLKWLREVKNCAWSSDITTFAMYFGNRTIIQYIIFQGTPVTLNTIKVAQKSGHLHILCDIILKYQKYIAYL